MTITLKVTDDQAAKLFGLLNQACLATSPAADEPDVWRELDDMREQVFDAIADGGNQ